MNVYSDLPDISQVMPRSAADDALFAELASVLAKHGALARFGLTLLHRHFDFRDGEMLLEETDVVARRQTFSPVIGKPGNTIETAWRLDRDGQAMTICICPADMRGNHLGDHISHGD
jgi:hypothetical protein